MKLIFSVITFSFSFISSAQTFWTENFNTGAGWTLVNVLGAEGSDPNFFQFTANEGGNITPNLGAPASCGVANNGNNTMHVTSVFFPAGGAAYDAGGLCGFWFCPQTNRRAQSPVINCTGQSAITASFIYIEGGQGATDNATFWYFDGAAWAQLDDMPKTLTGCGGQGLWVTRNVNLPASANNNANVRIGFRWVNNDDGVGSDPSFAVDNISLSTPTILPIDIVSFNSEALSQNIKINWSAFNANNFKGFSLEKSEDGIAFTPVSFFESAKLNREKQEYTFFDNTVNENILYYYRLKNVDNDGSYSYSNITSAKIRNYKSNIEAYFNGQKIVVKNTERLSDFNKIEVIDVTGKILLTSTINKELPETILNSEFINPGIYFLKIGNDSESRTVKVSVW